MCRWRLMTPSPWFSSPCLSLCLIPLHEIPSVVVSNDPLLFSVPLPSPSLFMDWVMTSHLDQCGASSFISLCLLTNFIIVLSKCASLTISLATFQNLSAFHKSVSNSLLLTPPGLCSASSSPFVSHMHPLFMVVLVSLSTEPSWSHQESSRFT